MSVTKVDTNLPSCLGYLHEGTILKLQKTNQDKKQAYHFLQQAIKNTEFIEYRAEGLKNRNELREVCKIYG